MNRKNPLALKPTTPTQNRETPVKTPPMAAGMPRSSIALHTQRDHQNRPLAPRQTPKHQSPRCPIPGSPRSRTPSPAGKTFRSSKPYFPSDSSPRLSSQPPTRHHPTKPDTFLTQTRHNPTKPDTPDKLSHWSADEQSGSQDPTPFGNHPFRNPVGDTRNKSTFGTFTVQNFHSPFRSSCETLLKNSTTRCPMSAGGACPPS